MMLEFYNFSLIINHRNDSLPGATFPIQMFTVVFIMQQFFLRSNHRERIDSLAFGNVCPGKVFCGELLHWVLILFETVAPYIIGTLLLPMVAKARVMHTHASIKKDREKDKSARLANIPEERTQAKVDDTTGKPVSSATPVEFVGNMQDAIAYVQMMNFVVLVCSAIFVWWTKNEVIFPQRSAPKFLFDLSRSLLMFPFMAFWC